jgi:hypothetical protein
MIPPTDLRFKRYFLGHICQEDPMPRLSEVQTGMETVCVSLEKEAATILRTRAAHKRRLGSFLSRLLYEFETRELAREEGRREVLAAMQAS